MEMRIEKCYFKNGEEMPADYKLSSFPELTELLDRVYARIENQMQNSSGGQDKYPA